MSFTLKVQDEAEEDIDSAFTWYEEQSVGLGSKFLEEIEEGFLLITNNPEHYGYYKPRPHYRRFLLKQFPFRIVYEIEENNIVVFRVLHVKRSKGF
jgi:plasmid stabilization system protein ParE